MPSVISAPLLKRRTDIPAWLRVCGYKRLAEIGVRAGTGLRLLALAQPDLLIGVDRWSASGDKSKNDGPLTQKALDGFYQNLCSLRRDFWPFLRLIRNDSVAAAAEVADGSLDFVFIDADHTYEAVRADLRAWWPKVRIGGTLAGHDFLERTTDDGVQFGVVQAVTEFAKQVGLDQPIHVTADKAPSWFITKTRVLTTP